MIGKILDTLFPSRVRARVEKENRLEEIRFNKFLEDKKKREDEKHPNAKWLRVYRNVLSGGSGLKRIILI